MTAGGISGRGEVGKPGPRGCPTSEGKWGGGERGDEVTGGWRSRPQAGIGGKEAVGILQEWRILNWPFAGLNSAG